MSEIYVSKYRAKGKRPARYRFFDCDHGETYREEYAVPNGQSSYVHYAVLVCVVCGVVVGQPKMIWKKTG